MLLLASYPGSSQFFSDARRKTREPGKIHDVRDVRWKGLGAMHAYTSHIYWEKCNRKTAGLSNLNLVQARTARNVSILVTFGVLYLLKLWACRTKSLPPDVTHVMNFTRLPHFSACIIEKLGGAWV